MFLLDGRFDKPDEALILAQMPGFNPCFYWMGVLTGTEWLLMSLLKCFNPCFYWMGVLTLEMATEERAELVFRFNPCFYWMGVLTFS